MTTTLAGQVPDTGSSGGSGFGLPRALVILLCGAAAVVVFAGVREAAWLIGPTFLALMIVIAVSPVASGLRRWGWPGWLTTLVVVVCVFGGMLALALGIIVSVAALATQVPQYAADADDLASSVTNWLAQFGVGTDQLKQAAASLDLSKLGGVLSDLLGSIAGLASSLMFLLALLLFLSVESSGWGERLLSITADRPSVARGTEPVRQGHAAVPAGHYGIRVHRRDPGHGRVGDHGRAAGPHVGTAGIHHQLHPEQRVHHRVGAPGVARVALRREPDGSTRCSDRPRKNSTRSSARHWPRSARHDTGGVPVTANPRRLPPNPSSRPRPDSADFRRTPLRGSHVHQVRVMPGSAGVENVP